MDRKLSDNAQKNLVMIVSSNLNEMIVRLMIPRSEHPVISAQIPKVPPKFAILSVVVVFTSSLFNSISELLYFSRTMIMLLIKFRAILK